MARTALVLASTALLVFTIGCNRRPSLNDDPAKESYAIGRRIGGSLKNEKISFEQKALFAGIQDGLDGKSELNDQQMAEAFTRMQQKSAQVEQAEANENLKKSDAFLGGNKQRPGVQESPSGLQFEVIQSGQGPKPKPSDVVKFHYNGTLLDGKKFDSSVDRGQPVTFPVQNLIPGWQEALVNMPVGSKWRLYVPPKLAYGPQARPGIPPNSMLTFDVELLGIEKAPPPPPGAPAGAGKSKKM